MSDDVGLALSKQFGAREHIAVIGAGIIGMSIAWHLARRGVDRIIVFDGAGIGAGATGLQPGGVRQQWTAPLTCRLARESYQFYSRLDDMLERRTGAVLEGCGYLFLAEGKEQFAQLGQAVATQNELGIPSRLITPDEACAIVPSLDRDQLRGASYCAEDGYFDRPQAVVAAFAEVCASAGVTFSQVNVAQISRDGAGWQLGLADGMRAWAEHVVVAASHDTPALVRRLAGELPIGTEARHLFYSDPIRERLLEPLVVSAERHFVAKQLADGSVLASDLAAEGDPAQHKAQWHRHVRVTISALLPLLEYVSFPLLVEGRYDVTPDRQPIVGPLDAERRLWVAAGMNGRGFMLAPAIGRMVAEGIVDSVSGDDLAALGADRFARGASILERQVV